MKLSKLRLLYVLLLAVALTACAKVPPEPTPSPIPPPSTLPPQFMVDGILYFNSGIELSGFRVADEDICGRIVSSVSLSQVPTVNDQSNFITGAPYAAHEHGYAMRWNSRWVLFVTWEDLQLLASGQPLPTQTTPTPTEPILP